MVDWSSNKTWPFLWRLIFTFLKTTAFSVSIVRESGVWLVLVMGKDYNVRSLMISVLVHGVGFDDDLCGRHGFSKTIIL